MKKNKNNFKAIAIIGVMFLSFGCNKITNINVDPNNPPLDKATPQVLFPSAVASSAGRIGGQLNILGGIWSEFYTQNSFSSQYRDIDSYNLHSTSGPGNADYNELFAGALNDYQLAINQSKTGGKWNFYLMNTLMKAYTYQVLVDLYDKVPYTEALKGQANIQPKFDDGYTVYKGLLAEIDFALAQNYNVPLNSKDAATDFIFGGDMAKWVQFANTLELKMYLRMINAKPTEAQAGVMKLYAAPNFLTVSAGMHNFTNSPNLDNPFYEFNIRSLNTTSNLKASKTFTTFLTATNDPRIVPYFGTANPIPINQDDYFSTDPTYQNATSPLQSPTDPVWFISAAESDFLQAEALTRYFGGAGAKDKYVAGVTASFSENGVTSSAANFIASSGDANVNWDMSANKIQTIIVQKWVSLAYGCHALEAFFDQERTGYPLISPVYSTNANYAALYPGQWVYGANGVTSGKFPKRLVFPDVERSRNANTPAEVPITTPVWWGK